MGNVSDTDSNSQKTQQLSIKHPNFLHAVRKTSVGKDSIETQLNVSNEEVYHQWTKQLHLIPQTEPESILYPLKHSYKSEGICASAGLVKIEYPNYSIILKQLIEERKLSQHRKFKQNQLWYLLYNLAEVGCLFHHQKKKIGDLRPLNIFLDSQQTIKIATSDSFPNQIDNFEKARINPDEKPYLAPEELDQLEFGLNKNKSWFAEADSFSAGLVLLDVTLLQNSQKLYIKSTQRKKYFDFDFQLLEGWKQNLKLENGYGSLLKYVILSLLELSPEDRITLPDVFFWLGDYSSQILNFDPFECDSLPDKLRKTSQKHNIIFLQTSERENNRFLVEAKKYPYIKKAQSKEIEQWPKYNSSPSNREKLNELSQLPHEESDEQMKKQTDFKCHLPRKTRKTTFIENILSDDEKQKIWKNQSERYLSRQKEKLFSKPPIYKPFQKPQKNQSKEREGRKRLAKDKVTITFKNISPKNLDKKTTQNFTEKYLKKTPLSSRVSTQNHNSAVRQNENIDKSNADAEKTNDLFFWRRPSFEEKAQVDDLIYSSAHKYSKKTSKVLSVETMKPQKSPQRRGQSGVRLPSYIKNRFSQKEILNSNREKAQANMSTFERIEQKIVLSKKLFPSPLKPYF